MTQIKVAPFTGAWIEILGISNSNTEKRSLPSRERGLKYSTGREINEDTRSLPSRERGLKYQSVDFELNAPQVAPFTGAWIEIIE